MQCRHEENTAKKKTARFVKDTLVGGVLFLLSRLGGGAGAALRGVKLD